ncbi:hypothetical protein DPMN_015297 [Dreissena polymorpha]|uniref:Uncharacterized protein n=1 Tax=Dreissena polymorpha TaxID=45954 RepID=A0A9D4NDD5_DREPO|nr:hypothetical protein DPMN_015297 [Dreissena polymorpha]
MRRRCQVCWRADVLPKRGSDQLGVRRSDHHIQGRAYHLHAHHGANIVFRRHHDVVLRLHGLAALRDNLHRSRGVPGGRSHHREQHTVVRDQRLLRGAPLQWRQAQQLGRRH